MSKESSKIDYVVASVGMLALVDAASTIATGTPSLHDLVLQNWEIYLSNSEKMKVTLGEMAIFAVSSAYIFRHNIRDIWVYYSNILDR